MKHHQTASVAFGNQFEIQWHYTFNEILRYSFAGNITLAGYRSKSVLHLNDAFPFIPREEVPVQKIGLCFCLMSRLCMAIVPCPIVYPLDCHKMPLLYLHRGMV